MKKKQIRNYGKNAASWGLSGTQVVADGLAAARQVLDIAVYFPTLSVNSWGKPVALSAGLLEGEIYRQNVSQGLNRLHWLGKASFRHYLIIRTFEADLAFTAARERELREQLRSVLGVIIAKGEHLLDEATREQLDLALKHYEEVPRNKSLHEECGQLKELLRCFEKCKTEGGQHAEAVIQAVSLTEALQALLNEQVKQDCSFLRSYEANQTLRTQARSLHHKSLIEKAEKHLAILEKTLVTAVLHAEWLADNSRKKHDITASCEEEISSSSHGSALVPTVNPALTEQIQKELYHATTRLWWLRCAAVFSLLVAIATGIATFYTFPAVLTGLFLGLSLTALSSIVWPLAIFSAISCGVLIYNTLADLIIHETLTHWWRKLTQEVTQSCDKQHVLKYYGRIVCKILFQLFFAIITWWKPKSTEHWFAYILRIVLSLAVLGLGMFATLATGYTAFVQLREYFSVVVCVITVLPLFMGDLLFILKNSFDSIHLLTSISLARLLNSVQAWWKALTQQMRIENLLQWTLHLARLPLLLLLNIFVLTVFFFHVFFMSVASDRLPGIPCMVTIVLSGISEVLTDICPLFSKEDMEEHKHGGIFSWLTKLIFVIPATLLGVLNWLFSQLNRFSSNPTVSKVLTLSEAVLQEWQQFDIRHRHAEHHPFATTIDHRITQLPQAIIKQHSIKICDKQIDRLTSSLFHSNATRKKVKVWTDIKNNIGPRSLPITDETEEVLAVHRYCKFFKSSSTQTTSQRKLHTLETWLLLLREEDNSSQANPVLA